MDEKRHTFTLTQEEASGLSIGSVVEIRVKGVVNGIYPSGESVSVDMVGGEVEVVHPTMRDAFMAALASSQASPTHAAGSVIPSGG